MHVLLWKREREKKRRTNQSRCVNLSQNSFVVYTYLQKSTCTHAHLLPGQVSQRELRATVAMQDIQESQRRACFKGSKRNGPLFAAFCEKRNTEERRHELRILYQTVAVDLTIRSLGFRHYCTYTLQSLGNRSVTRDKFSRSFFFFFFYRVLTGRKLRNSKLELEKFLAKAVTNTDDKQSILWHHSVPVIIFFWYVTRVLYVTCVSRTRSRQIWERFAFREKIFVKRGRRILICLCRKIKIYIVVVIIIFVF